MKRNRRRKNFYSLVTFKVKHLHPMLFRSLSFCSSIKCSWSNFIHLMCLIFFYLDNKNIEKKTNTYSSRWLMDFNLLFDYHSQKKDGGDTCMLNFFFVFSLENVSSGKKMQGSVNWSLIRSIIWKTNMNRIVIERHMSILQFVTKKNFVSYQQSRIIFKK